MRDSVWWILSTLLTLTHSDPQQQSISVFSQWHHCCPIKSLFTSTSLTNTSMSVSESFASSSHRLMLWLCQDSRRKPIGQQHNLIFMTCFALTIYGWKWACRGDLKADPRTNVSRWTVIYKVNIAFRRAYGFINLNFLLGKPFPAFVPTYTFSMNPTHCFINETQGLDCVTLTLHPPPCQ